MQDGPPRIWPSLPDDTRDVISVGPMDVTQNYERHSDCRQGEEGLYEALGRCSRGTWSAFGTFQHEQASMALVCNVSPTYKHRKFLL